MEMEIGKKQSTIQRLRNTGQLTRLTIYLAAGIPAAIFLILALLVFLKIISPLSIGGTEIGETRDYLLFALFLGTGTFGFYEAITLHHIRKIDARFPDFVRDLAESRRAGMTFTKAILYASKGNYGVLTPEIQKIARQISWGSSVDSALSAFAKRVNTKLIRRTISLIIEAGRSGGNVADVLDAASKDAREIKFLESERRANMMSYVAVIYVGMGVFLLIILILSSGLLPQITGEGAASFAAGTHGGEAIREEHVLPVFYLAAIIQSIGMGIVTGVFEEGRMVSGIKHVFIMTFIAWFVFKFMVGY